MDDIAAAAEFQRLVQQRIDVAGLVVGAGDVRAHHRGRPDEPGSKLYDPAVLERVHRPGVHRDGAAVTHVPRLI